MAQPPASNPSAQKPLTPASDWGKFALGYALLWLLLVAATDAGWGSAAAALALLIAGSASLIYGPRAIANLGLGG